MLIVARCKKSILPFLAPFLIALVVIGCGSSVSSTNSGAGGNDSSSAKVAPDFSVKTLTGETVSLANLKEKGKPILLNFAASWCPPCELEAPVLAKGYEKYKNEVTFFGIAVKDDENSQRAFAQRHGLNFPIGLDPNEKVISSFQKAGKVNVSGIPTTFFLDKDGIIVSFFIGPLSEKDLDQKIAGLKKS